MTETATDLIRRLEEATEGSYELSLAVGDFVGSFQHYTTSIDAALTLVPEGWEWVLEWETNPDIARCKMGNPDIGLIFEAPTLALAFCAAALRARRPDME